MKKRLIMISMISLILIMGVFTLTGCGDGNEDTKNSKSTNTAVYNDNNQEDKNIVKIGDEKFKLKSEANIQNCYFLENYVDFQTDTIGDIKKMTYKPNGKLAFEVRVMGDDGRSIEELKALITTKYKCQEQSKEINGNKYVYFEYNAEDGVKVHHYIFVYSGKAYSIGFFLGENPGNIEEVFMNNVSFK